MPPARLGDTGVGGIFHYDGEPEYAGFCVKCFRQLSFGRLMTQKSRTRVLNPEDYSGAVGELFAVVIAMSWTLTLIFEPDIVKKNVLRDRLGYNNVCVGFDAYPANVFAAFFWALVVFFICRYAELDIMRLDLNWEMGDKNKNQIPLWKYRFVYISNIWLGLAYAFFIGCFVINPGYSPVSERISQTVQPPNELYRRKILLRRPVIC